MTLDLTRPLFTWPHKLTATNHLRVSYNDATSQNVSLSAGTYYPDGTGIGLLAQLQTQLNSDATNGGTWTVQYGADWTIQITHTGGSKTVSLLSFLTDELRGLDLGFDSDAVSAAGPAQSFLAPYRPARLWTSDEPLTINRFDLEPVVNTSRSRFNGRVLTEKRSALYGVRTFSYVIPTCAGALGFGFAADQQAFCDLVDAAAPWMVAGDPNTPMDKWMERYLAGCEAGVPPRARVAKDRGTPGVYDDVVLFPGQTVRDVIEQVNDEPLLVTVRVLAAPWVA